MYCLKGMGTKNKAEKFITNMVEPFKNYETSYNVSIKNLKEHNMLNKDGDLTIIGAACNQFGKFDHKIGKMILGGYYLGVMPECIALGAIINEINSIHDISKELELNKNIIKKFEIGYSDHLTLLNIFVRWYHNKNRNSFVNENRLNANILRRIENTYKELQEVITKRLLDEIPDLELFRVIGDKHFIFGGGEQEKKSNNSYISNKNGKSIFSRHIGEMIDMIDLFILISSQSSDETEEIRQFIQRAGKRETKDTRFTDKFRTLNLELNIFDISLQSGGRRKKEKSKKVENKVDEIVRKEKSKKQKRDDKIRDEIKK